MDPATFLHFCHGHDDVTYPNLLSTVIGFMCWEAILIHCPEPKSRMQPSLLPDASANKVLITEQAEIMIFLLVHVSGLILLIRLIFLDQW